MTIKTHGNFYAFKVSIACNMANCTLQLLMPSSQLSWRPVAQAGTEHRCSQRREAIWPSRKQVVSEPGRPRAADAPPPQLALLGRALAIDRNGYEGARIQMTPQKPTSWNRSNNSTRGGSQRRAGKPRSGNVEGGRMGERARNTPESQLCRACPSSTPAYYCTRVTAARGLFTTIMSEFGCLDARVHRSRKKHMLPSTRWPKKY